MATLASAIVGVFALIASVLMDYSGDLFESICGEHRRFYACTMLSFAVCGFVVWLVQDHYWKNTVCLTALALGVILGLLWERQTR